MSTVLITGANKGIGYETARQLVAAGHTVYVGARDADRGRAAADTLGARFIQLDVSDDASVEAAAKSIEADGGLDVLVNNAGIGAQGMVADNDDAEWHRVFDVNVVGMVRVTRAALPHLRESPAAAIVNTCSIAATAGLPQRALYSATKGAVLALTRAMAADHLAEGIRVCCVNPGTAHTPWIDRLLAQADDPAAELAALAARQPTGRLVTADEVAAAICYLAGPDSGATTGTDLAVDGGMSGLRLRPKPVNEERS